MLSGAILLSLLGWGITFGVHWGNFWIKIGLTVTMITVYSLYWQRPHAQFSRAAVIGGIFSAAVLYGIFYVGNFLAGFIIPGAGHQVSAIYSLGIGTNHLPVAFILLFITGPGEEIFWRGFLQNQLAQRCGKLKGFLLATLLYGGHIFSGNIMLIGAAFVAGSFWGIIYLWRQDLLMVIISHSLWSAFIFALRPIT